MILYHGDPNGPSLTVLAALEESGLAVECRAIDLLAGERHALPGISERVALDMSVEGEGPVLVCGGEAMTDAIFIAQFLDRQAGHCGLQPRDPHSHWQMMMWCRQVTERLSPAVALLGNLANSRDRLRAMADADFTRLVEAVASADLRERWIALRDGDPDPAQVQDSMAKIDEFAARVESRLEGGRGWLIGGFSIADLATYAWMTGAVLLREEAFAGKPRLEAWLRRAGGRDCVRKALARSKAADPRRSFAPGPEINRWG